MYKNPLVSVIVPTYNAASYLQECLNSIFAQTYSNYEIICIDNGSSDSTQSILFNNAKNHSNMIVLINERNLGPGGSRNRGIEHARGDLITIIDSDDYVDSDFLATYVNAINTSQTDIVIGSFKKVHGRRITRQKISNSVWSLLSYGVPWGRMFKKKVFSGHCKFSGQTFGEDIYFNMSLYFKGASFTVIDYDGYYFRINQNSTTKSEEFRLLIEKNVVAMFNEFLQIYPYEHMNREDQWIFQYLFISNLILALSFSKGCGLITMRDKRNYIFEQIESLFPDYRNNPYIGILKPKTQRAHIRIAVGVAMRLHRIHLDAPVWGLYSLLK